MTDFMKCRKHSRGSVPWASCFTKSCSTYAFHVCLDDWIRIRVNGCGLLGVGLPIKSAIKLFIIEARHTHGGTSLTAKLFKWLSGPCPRPIGDAVSISRCVYFVANLVASKTERLSARVKR